MWNWSDHKNERKIRVQGPNSKGWEGYIQEDLANLFKNFEHFHMKNRNTIYSKIVEGKKLIIRKRAYENMNRNMY